MKFPVNTRNWLEFQSSSLMWFHCVQQRAASLYQESNNMTDRSSAEDQKQVQTVLIRNNEVKQHLN